MNSALRCWCWLPLEQELWKVFGMIFMECFQTTSVHWNVLYYKDFILARIFHPVVSDILMCFQTKSGPRNNPLNCTLLAVRENLISQPDVWTHAESLDLCKSLSILSPSDIYGDTLGNWNKKMNIIKGCLKMSESQWLDQCRDWKGLSLNKETETENIWVSMMRPRPRLKRSDS